MNRSTLFGLAASFLLAISASAQQSTRPFPMDVVATESSRQEVVLAPRLDEIRILGSYRDVLLTGMPLFDGAQVDLALTRIDVARRGFGFYVDGAPRADLLDGLDLTVWKGHVVGDPASRVVLSFSNYGSRGWVIQGGEVLHLIGRPDENGSWVGGDVLSITEASLNAQGMALAPYCAADNLYLGREETFDSSPDGTTTLGLGGSCGLKECRIAMETDWQLHQVFGSLPAMTSYMTTLLTAISDRYEEQIGTTLTFPYLQFYTSSADPWSTPDSGGNTSQMLDEFRSAWLGNIPNGAHLAHFVSGAGLGGGIAYLDVLCNPDFAFAVSGNIGGDVQFPIQQQSGNWDFMVIAHELGHNFSAPHTHDFNPPIDNCAGGECITNGTIMSYCHLCAGGTANITTYFHPQNVTLMTNASQSCLPDFGGSIFGEEVALVSDSAPTTVTAQVFGTVLGSVDLVYRYDGGAFQTVAMNGVGNTYTADLPAASCDDTPEYYYTFTDADCGVVVDPPGAPAATYTALVGSLTSVFLDDFESATGWSEVNLGATSGDWQRGVPVDDSGWAYDPAADYDGSGSAYLTQNENGNTDVDDGAVRLFSPILDMSSASSAIQYAYYLRLTNSNGTDALIVEMDTNGGAGPWTEIARHDTDGGLSWRTHFISAAELAGLGLVPSATAQIRFTANDGDPQSIVEAGIDAFEISTLSCDSCPAAPPTNYCTAVPNATGSPSAMSTSGSTSVAANDLMLLAGPLPTFMNGLFIYSPDQDEAPLGNGNICLGSTTLGFILRLPHENSGVGIMSHAFDNTAPPHPLGLVTPGSTWFFQCWHRDPDPPAFFNFSDGLQITFCP